MRIVEKYHLQLLIFENGRCLFSEWLHSLQDDDRAMIDHRLARVRQGNFGEMKSIGDGMFELKLRKGPGYRIYFGIMDKKDLLIICGGVKGTQKKDIRLSKQAYQQFKLNRERR
jgi:putative addiction module killer protein